MSKIEGLQKKRKELGMRIKPDFRFIKGSVVVLKVTCGKANCRCMKGEKHQAVYLSQSVNGKTRMTYIPGKYVKMVTEYVKNSKSLLKTLHAISEANLNLVKERGEL